MRILIVAATAPEVAPIVARLGRADDRHPRVTRYRHADRDVDVLITGVGLVATGVWCAETFSRGPYDLALNVGICGSFDRALGPGTVVHVVSERIADLGAEDGDSFLTVEELELLAENEPPFTAGQLVNPRPPVNAALSRLPTVTGVSVNTVHGNERSIEAVVKRFGPHVESMEGAAFMYACLVHHLSFAEIRAVSNFVERRNRAAWRIQDAIAALGRAAIEIIEAA